MSTGNAGESRKDQVAKWYREYGPALVAYASAMIGDRSSAEDALQQVFLKLLKGKLGAPADPKGYLFRAVRNTSLNLSSHNRRNVAFDAEQTCEGWFEAPSELGYWSAKLEGAIRTLPSEQAEVVVMRIWGEMTFQEIAAVLDVSVNTAASRYRYGIARLRELMQPLEVRSEHAAQ